MKLLVLATLSLVFLAACQQSAGIRESSQGPYRQIQNASLELKQDVLVPAGKARIYLQDGKQGGFDSYRPHCALEINRVDHSGYPLKAGTFAVTRVQQSRTQVVSAAPLLVAFAGGMGGGSASYYQGYHFWLSSDTEAEIRRMSCYGVFAQPYELYPPTLQEINAALGDVAQLRY
jgi:hypothetical protein